MVIKPNLWLCLNQWQEHVIKCHTMYSDEAISVSMRHKLTWAHWHHDTLSIREACLKIKIHIICCCRIAQLPLQCGVDLVLMAEFESHDKHDIISIIFVVVVIVVNTYTTSDILLPLKEITSIIFYLYKDTNIMWKKIIVMNMAQVFQNRPASHTYMYKSRHILFFFLSNRELLMGVSVLYQLHHSHIV